MFWGGILSVQPLYEQLFVHKACQSDRCARLVLIGSDVSIQWFGFSIMEVHTVTSSSVESIQLTASP